MEEQLGSAMHSLNSVSLAIFNEAFPTVPAMCVYMHGNPLQSLFCIRLRDGEFCTC